MIDNIFLVLLIVLLGAKLLGGLFQGMGLDSSVGELLTGLILGKSLLNIIDASSIETFALMGSVLILFVAGLKQQDIDEVYRDKKSMKLGILLLLITAAAMSLFFYYVPRLFDVNLNLLQSVVMGIAFAIIDIGVPAKILISKNLIDNPVAKITLRSSIINIILGLFMFTFVTMIISYSLSDLLFKVLGTILFLLLTVFIVYFLSGITRFVMKSHIEEAEFSLALILVLALAYFTEVLGFSSILGAFIAGTLIAKFPFAETSSFTQKMRSLSLGLFVPLFFVWFGLEVELDSIIENLALVVLVFVAYAALRFLIAYLFMKSNRLKAPGLASSSLLSVDVESLVVLIVAIRLGVFIDNTPLTLFAPSVLLSTLLIVILVAYFSKKELKNKVRAVAE